MRRLSLKATTFLMLFAFTVMTCFAQGGFAVSSGNGGTAFFAIWASTANAKPLVGDFNGDGRTDVALTGASGWKTVPVAFSNGDGTFNVTSVPITNNNFPFWAATAGAIPLVGDFNGDGKADVTLTGAPNWATLAVAFSNGDGTFTVTNQPITNFAVWAATAGAVPLIGDFNGDGKSDVALIGASSFTFVAVAFSNGDGTFTVTNPTSTNFAGWAATAGAVPLVGDFNDDGRTDLALTGPSAWTFIPVALSNGDGSFNVTNSTATNFAAWAATANAKPLVGDFNGDGRTDVALTGPSAWTYVPVAFSNGDGTFNVVNPTTSNFPGWAATAGAVPLVGDFNADGRADVALTGPSSWSTVVVAFSNGDGSFNATNQPILDFGGWAATTGAKPLLGDFNGDGRTDLALTGPSAWRNVPLAFSLTPAVRVVNMVPASLSGETNQDSEPFLALNPDFPTRMTGTAFTPNPGYPQVTNPAPIYVSQNSGFTWALNTIVPSSGQHGTSDITVVGMGDATANRLYSGILADPGDLLFDQLTTADFTNPTVMTSQASRISVDQPFVQGLRSNSLDHVYVGNKDFTAAPATASVDVTANGGASWSQVQIDKRTGCNDHLPPIRPAVAPDGTVYAAFFHCTSRNGSIFTSDVVVVRDDSWGTGSTPFTALIDPGDNLAGMRVVSNVTVPWVPGPALGNQRIGSALSLAVDPNNSANVYVGWADRVGNGDIYTIHVRCSTNRGVTWSSADLLTVTNATNLALAIGNSGAVGALYQQVTGSAPNQRWVTTLVQTKSFFAGRQSTILSTAPVTTPVFQPYLGEYLHLLAVGTEFRGIFSANNTPNLANFPQGVSYQRQVNFTTMTLLNGAAPVASSIDPFFFSVPILF